MADYKGINERLDSRIAEMQSATLYMGIGRRTPWNAEDQHPMSAPNIEDIFFMKRSRDISKVIARYDWKEGMEYGTGLDARAFYVINSNNQVFVCTSSPLTPSEVEPVYLTTEKFATSDGYGWQFLYEIDMDSMAKFATPSFIPLMDNSQGERLRCQHLMVSNDINGLEGGLLDVGDEYRFMCLVEEPKDGVGNLINEYRHVGTPSDGILTYVRYPINPFTVGEDTTSLRAIFKTV